jgi:DnaJ-class molecular chaperone
MALDLYQRLGLKRGASEAEIKKAYRSLAKQLHPDRNKDNPEAAKRFGEVTQAYDLLSDKNKRAQYDRGEIDDEGNPKMPFGGGFGGRPGSGAGPGAGPGGAGFEGFSGDFGEAADISDLFEGLFGANAARGGRAGPGGFGRVPPADTAAPKRCGCGLSAKNTVRRCSDAGSAAYHSCRRKTIDVKLPKGLEDGTRIRLAGKGEPGPAGNGDAIVTVSIAPHPFYTREGNHIRLRLPVTLKEAVLGAKVKVPTPEGPVMMAIPKGSSSGRVLRLKGRGFTSKSGARGDELVTVEVQIPSGDAELEAFADEWNGGGNPRASLGV